MILENHRPTINNYNNNMRRNSVSFPIGTNQSSSCSLDNLSESAKSTRSLSFKSTSKRPKLSEDEKVTTFNHINDFENAEKELFKHSESLDEMIATTTPTSADTSSTSVVLVGSICKLLL